MRDHIVPVVAAVIHLIIEWFFSKLWSMFLIPFAFIFRAHLMRKACGIIAGGQINSGLRCKTKIKLAGIDYTFRTHETRELWCFSPKAQPAIDRNTMKVEQNDMQIGHISSVFPAEYTTQCCS